MKVFVTGAAGFIGSSALIQSTGSQPTTPPESALLLSNPTPGAYTAILRGKNLGTDAGVVEVCVFLINVSA
jgi:hypothetical protein